MDAARIVNLGRGPAEVLANPRLPDSAVAPLVRALRAENRFDGHVAVMSSGTTSAVAGTNKWVLLSTEALMASAAAVNGHLSALASDVWANPLPLFHVGGLGIHFRATLTGSRVVSVASWRAPSFVDTLESERVTLTSLVPAQVHDLIAQRLQSPASVRAVIVGGGKLEAATYRAARALGWPLLASYGLSEGASQVATSLVGDFPEGTPGELQLLPHWSARIEDDGVLSLSGPALLTAYAEVSSDEVRFRDPKRAGWLRTSDRVELAGTVLRHLGRVEDVVKIGGENTDIARLAEHLDEVTGRPAHEVGCALVALPDERLGARIVLAVSPRGRGEAPRIVAEFNRDVMPYERIRETHAVGAIPRTELGKIRRAALADEILLQLSANGVRNGPFRFSSGSGEDVDRLYRGAQSLSVQQPVLQGEGRFSEGGQPQLVTALDATAQGRLVDGVRIFYGHDELGALEPLAPGKAQVTHEGLVTQVGEREVVAEKHDACRVDERKADGVTGDEDTIHGV